MVGDVEPESPHAGGLLDELIVQSADAGVSEATELADLGLLAGSLMLCCDSGSSACPRLARRHVGVGLSAGGYVSERLRF